MSSSYTADRVHVTAQAKGQIRLLRAALQENATRLITASEKVPRGLLRDVRHRTSTARDRAMKQILSMMQAPPLYQEKRAALWRLFMPEDSAIVVRALAFGAHGTGSWTNMPFGLGYSAHSISRLLERTNFTADPIAAMVEGHDALLRLRPDEGDRVFNLKEASVPGGPGAFIIVPHPDRDYPFAMATTWVSCDQTRRDQDDDLAAWRTLALS